MNQLFLLVNKISRSGTSSGTDSGSSSSSADRLVESLKEAFKGPIPYIIIGAIVLLIIAIYLLRRFVKARPGYVRIVVRHGQIYKVLDENNPKYFLVPFTDSLAADIPLNEQVFASDKMFINNGPDALYKINYVLNYQVSEPTKFFGFMNDFQNLANTKINDIFRDYADNGNAMNVVKDYRKHEEELLDLFNKAVEDYGVKVNSFKINFVEPLGKK